MKLVIKTNPTQYTLIERLLIPDESATPDGYTPSTEQDAQAWVNQQLANGWTAAEHQPPPAPVPQEVGRGQLHAAFVALEWITPTSPGAVVAEVNTWITGMIDTAIADAGERTIAHALWGTAGTFKRAHPFMALVAAMAGKTSEDIDQLFRTAATF